MIETLKEAIAKTYQKHIDAPEAQVRVSIEKNEMHVYHQLMVVDDETDTFDETLDILLSDALERVIHFRKFEAQFFLVGHMLQITAAALAIIGTRGINSGGGREKKLFRTCVSTVF